MEKYLYLYLCLYMYLCLCLYLYFHAKHCWHELYTEAAPIRASALIPLNFGELLLLDGWRFGYLFAIIMMMMVMMVMMMMITPCMELWNTNLSKKCIFNHGDSDGDGDGDGDNVKSGADNACLCRALNVSNNCFGNCRGCHAFFQWILLNVIIIIKMWSYQSDDDDDDDGDDDDDDDDDDGDDDDDANEKHLRTKGWKRWQVAGRLAAAGEQFTQLHIRNTKYKNTKYKNTKNATNSHCHAS